MGITGKMASDFARRNIFKSSSPCSFRNLSVCVRNLTAIEQSSTKDKSVTHLESTHKGDLNLVSGIPIEQIKDRKVTISLPSRNAMQSGTHNMRKWTISFDTQERWENPL